MPSDDAELVEVLEWVRFREAGQPMGITRSDNEATNAMVVLRNALAKSEERVAAWREYAGASAEYCEVRHDQEEPRWSRDGAVVTDRLHAARAKLVDLGEIKP